ncbi:sugar-binding transcriptional regulator [Salinibacterium sp. NK8237]|uniref:sugar-binding transcriptional regulator n=1 Tax=Salinibacterium sp. NK8237 TaxID=2792038 RepID=UPI0018CD0D92|nr:sugar-binding transcriptional regulator [Salinibacterium sp. NK8237]MBH0131514.1 sugar-binding transcriptional regulator [Salinibacterium sp. NK8237]
MDESTELLAVRVAELYYEENKTQDEVGALLGITRWKVGRLLTRAREAGIVRIEIVHPRARRLDVERQLRDRFGLKDAVVVPLPADDEEVSPRVAQAAADYLAAVRPIPRTLGVSWGRTLDEVARLLADGWTIGVQVVQINGGVSLNSKQGTAEQTAVTIAQKGHGQAMLLPIPAILEQVETKRAIERDRTVANVRALGASASAYLYSAGVAGASSVHVDSGYLTESDVDELVAKGAVGDVVGRYIDSAGKIVDSALDERTVGIGLDELRAAEHAIFVVAGDAKHDVARAVVTSGLCSVIVTDEATAHALLEETT